MKDKTIPVFLERRSYRQRRLMDFARLLPFIGGLLWLVPLLWPQPEAMGAPASDGGGLSMSSAILYVFGVWALLVAGVLVVARYVLDSAEDAGGADGPDA
jgi:hypothetical protein